MKKKTLWIILAVVAVIVVIGLIGVKLVFDEATRQLEEEEKVLNTFEISTKNGEKVELEYVKFENGEFFLKLPKNFKQMDEEAIKVKYQNGNPPSFAFSNDATTVSIAVTISDVEMKNEAIKPYVESMKSQFASTFEIIETKTTEKDGHDVGELTFVSKGLDTDVYNHLICFSCNDKLRVVGFNTTKELQEEWQDVGKFIMNSILFEQK